MIPLSSREMSHDLICSVVCTAAAAVGLAQCRTVQSTVGPYRPAVVFGRAFDLRVMSFP